MSNSLLVLTAKDVRSLLGMKPPSAPRKADVAPLRPVVGGTR